MRKDENASNNNIITAHDIDKLMDRDSLRRGLMNKIIDAMSNNQLKNYNTSLIEIKYCHFIKYCQVKCHFNFFV